jgi:hypothetical protein
MVVVDGEGVRLKPLPARFVAYLICDAGSGGRQPTSSL